MQAADTDKMGKLFAALWNDLSRVTGSYHAFCPALAGFRLGVYPAKRGSSTFTPAPKTNL
jgi:hypothetical protein